MNSWGQLGVSVVLAGLGVAMTDLLRGQTLCLGNRIENLAQGIRPCLPHL